MGEGGASRRRRAQAHACATRHVRGHARYAMSSSAQPPTTPMMILPVGVGPSASPVAMVCVFARNERRAPHELHSGRYAAAHAVLHCDGIMWLAEQSPGPPLQHVLVTADRSPALHALACWHLNHRARARAPHRAAQRVSVPACGYSGGGIRLRHSKPNSSAR
jgi:hypothetical protein